MSRGLGDLYKRQQLVSITPAEVGAAIENQNRIDGAYLIVDTKVQNLL